MCWVSGKVVTLGWIGVQVEQQCVLACCVAPRLQVEIMPEFSVQTVAARRYTHGMGWDVHAVFTRSEDMLPRTWRTKTWCSMQRHTAHTAHSISMRATVYSHGPDLFVALANFWIEKDLPLVVDNGGLCSKVKHEGVRHRPHLPTAHIMGADTSVHSTPLHRRRLEDRAWRIVVWPSLLHVKY